MSKDDGPRKPVVSAIVQGAAATAGGALSVAHPDLAVPLAGLVAVADALVPSLMERVSGFRRGQVAKAVAAGAANEGVDPEVLVEQAVRTEFRQLLTADMLEAAAHTAHEPKLVALGRAWARGMITEEEAIIAIEHQFVRTIARLEVPHFRALEALDHDPKAWRALFVSTPHGVEQKVPEYGGLVDQLLAALAAEGLVTFGSIESRGLTLGSKVSITDAGREVLRRLAEAAETVDTAGSGATPEER